MSPRHYQIIRRGDITIIRTARGEAIIRPSDLPRLIAELRAINVDINHDHSDDPERSGGNRLLGSSDDGGQS